MPSERAIASSTTSAACAGLERPVRTRCSRRRVRARTAGPRRVERERAARQVGRRRRRSRARRGPIASSTSGTKPKKKPPMIVDARAEPGAQRLHDPVAAVERVAAEHHAVRARARDAVGERGVVLRPSGRSSPTPAIRTPSRLRRAPEGIREQPLPEAAAVVEHVDAAAARAPSRAPQARRRAGRRRRCTRT